MTTNKVYIFKSDRLGFRNWVDTDIEKMSEINSDPLVMEFFLSTKSKQETTEFIERMQKQFEEKGYCYFAVDKLEDGEFIGFIGLSEQTFESSFTPFFDIGWRLSRKVWNNGYATEGARRCLEYAFNNLNVTKVNSTAVAINLKSEHIMRKIGMTKVMNFKHPKLASDERLEECVLYEIVKQ